MDGSVPVNSMLWNKISNLQWPKSSKWQEIWYILPEKALKTSHNWLSIYRHIPNIGVAEYQIWQHLHYPLYYYSNLMHPVYLPHYSHPVPLMHSLRTHLFHWSEQGVYDILGIWQELSPQKIITERIKVCLGHTHPGWTQPLGQPSSTPTQVAYKDLQLLNFGIQTAWPHWTLNREDWHEPVSTQQSF